MDNDLKITVTITYPPRLMKHMGRILETIEFLIRRAGFKMDIQQHSPNTWYTMSDSSDTWYTRSNSSDPIQWSYTATTTTDGSTK